MLPIFKDDPHLSLHESNIMHRINAFRGWKEQFRKHEGGLGQFAEGYKTFGFQRHESRRKWTFTEWLPEAREVFLIGDFNNWENTHPLKSGEFGRWSIDLPDTSDGWAVPHRSQFRLRIRSDHGTVDRVPAWTKLAWQNPEFGVFNGVMWEPPPSARYVMRHARPERPASLKIYEVHLGIADTEDRPHTYQEFKEILPQIQGLGYNALQIMAVAEHDQSSYGYDVTNFFAPSSRFGDPEELKELIDTAHACGFTVLMDLVHSHFSSNQVDGIDQCYTHDGQGKQDQWHASLFDYGKYEVLRFLLSNIRWWIEEYGFDGFRFAGVTSMLYISHGIGKHFGHDYQQYFGKDADSESGTYLMLANSLVKRLLPKSGLTIAEDFSSMPTLCRAVDDGGFGFDYSLSVNVPPILTEMLEEQPDETWSVSRVVEALQKKCSEEPIYTECHDQDFDAKQPEPEPQNQVAKQVHSEGAAPLEIGPVDQVGVAVVLEAELQEAELEDACDFLAMLPDQALTTQVMKPQPLESCQPVRGVPLVACLPARQGSVSLLPELDTLEACPVACEASDPQEDPQALNVANRSQVLAEFYQNLQDKSSRSKSRRRRRRSHKERIPERLPEGSPSLLPQLSLEASEATEQEDPQAYLALYKQESKTSRHKSRRRRRKSKEIASEPAGQQLEAEEASLEEKHAAAVAAKAAMIQALREEQEAVRRALAEAQVARMQREAEEAEMRQQEQARALQAAKMRQMANQRFGEEKPMLMTQRKGSMSLLPEPEAMKSPAPAAPAQVVVSKGRTRQVAEPKFARRAPQARASKSLPPKKVPAEYGSMQADGSLHYTRQALQVNQSRLMEEPPMMNYDMRKGSFSLLPEMHCKLMHQEDAELPWQMEAEHTDLPQDDFKEASNLSRYTDCWGDADHCDFRKEGHLTPTSGTQTPKTKAVSEPNSDSGPEMMERIYSLSALDALLQDPDAKTDLRHQLECDELEDRRPKYTSTHLNRPVVVVSSEVNPWSKTGGLAMVTGSYGYEFAMRGHRTMVVSPRYGAYDGAHYVGCTRVWIEGTEHEVKFFHLYQDLGDGNGTDYIFVGHDCFMRGGLYCDPQTGREYQDNLFRFSLLTVAALEAPLILNIRGSTFGQDVLFIANDWQTGLLPVYHLYKYRRNNTYRNSRCIFVIHNIGYQGKYRLSKYPVDGYLGLPLEAQGFLQGEDLNMGNDCMNLMSAAILASDRVLTVSPNYAAEIQSPEGGQGLHEILQQKGYQNRMAGILNGIADEWNPKTDPHIPMNYSIRTFEEGKAVCKRELQRSLGLHEDPGAALIGFCGRLCYQKGVHLITQIIPWLLTYESSGVLGRVQVILMGKGEDIYATQLANAEGCNKGRVCGYVGFDPKVEHRMLAACDFLMMPSQYEPCGLPQMYAQAYGTVPVVHETGGLKDSVSGLWDEHRNRDTATGFLFCGFDENHLKERMYQALEVYHKKQDLFRQIQMNGLRKNYYWPQAIDEYERQLDWTLDSDAAAS